MDATALAAIGGVVVSLLAAVGTIANNRRQHVTTAAANSATAQTEAQRVALEGLRTLIAELQEALGAARTALQEARSEATSAKSEASAAKADAAACKATNDTLTAQLGQLQALYREALERMDLQASRQEGTA